MCYGKNQNIHPLWSSWPGPGLGNTDIQPPSVDSCLWPLAVKVLLIMFICLGLLQTSMVNQQWKCQEEYHEKQVYIFDLMAAFT